jgi:hypothetical protein
VIEAVHSRPGVQPHVEGEVGSRVTVASGPALDRYGRLYPEADSALRDRLDALYGTADRRS